ncbi:nitrogen regulation protein NR(II) [Leptospira sp. WS58.C1]|uniref:two-component system sensor histidine kinase NtrB n=1 Tax=Leptospira cinconiae TaxID=3235173 RepID=UPI00349E6AB1
MQHCDEIPPKINQPSDFLEKDFLPKEIGLDEWFCQAAQFKNILYHSPNGFAIVSLDGKFISSNPALSQILGYSENELIGISLDSITHADETEEDISSIDQFSNGPTPSFKRKKRYIHKDGHLLWVQIDVTLIRNQTGNPNYFAIQFQDITKHHELEKQLIHSQRMESIGSLAGGVAHDFNNILTVVLGYTTLLEKNSEHPEKILQYSEIIKKTAERGSSLIKQLLTLARKVESDLKPSIANDLLLEAIHIASSTFPKSIRVISDLPQDPILVQADHNQIHQVFLNLFLNAKDAMPNGGLLSIRLRMEEGKFISPEKTQKTAVIEILDSGTGIDRKTIRKIFDPFFTTKEPGKGTGLGLSIAYGILENHKGKIKVESELGSGTKFSVFLPVLE